MEYVSLGNGLYLKPYKTGNGLWLYNENFNGKKNFDVILPQRALTNADILKYAKILKIPYFRSVFMRNNLPKNGSLAKECEIINLEI